MRLLDKRFKYVSSGETDVSLTWRKFGFKPTTETERRARQRRLEQAEAAAGSPELVVSRTEPAAPRAIARSRRKLKLAAGG